MVSEKAKHKLRGKFGVDFQCGLADIIKGVQGLTEMELDQLVSPDWTQRLKDYNSLAWPSASDVMQRVEDPDTARELLAKIAMPKEEEIFTK